MSFVTRCQGSGKKRKRITAPNMVRKVKKKIKRNQCSSSRKMVLKLNIWRERIQHILRNEIRLKLLQNLADAQNKVRLARIKEMLRCQSGRK